MNFKGIVELLYTCPNTLFVVIFYISPPYSLSFSTTFFSFYCFFCLLPLSCLCLPHLSSLISSYFLHWKNIIFVKKDHYFCLFAIHVFHYFCSLHVNKVVCSHLNLSFSNYSYLVFFFYCLFLKKNYEIVTIAHSYSILLHALSCCLVKFGMAKFWLNFFYLFSLFSVWCLLLYQFT